MKTKATEVKADNTKAIKTEALDVIVTHHLSLKRKYLPWLCE